MLNPILLVVNALAVARIERLISRDTFPPIAWVREHVLDRLNRNRNSAHWLDDLVSCPWCLSIWVAGAVTVLATLVPFWTWVAVPLAFSAVTGHLAARERE